MTRVSFVGLTTTDALNGGWPDGLASPCTAQCGFLTPQTERRRGREVEASVRLLEKIISLQTSSLADSAALIRPYLPYFLTQSSIVTCLATFFPAPGCLGSSGLGFLAGGLSSYSATVDGAAAFVVKNGDGMRCHTQMEHNISPVGSSAWVTGHALTPTHLPLPQHPSDSQCPTAALTQFPGGIPFAVVVRHQKHELLQIELLIAVLIAGLEHFILQQTSSIAVRRVLPQCTGARNGTCTQTHGARAYQHRNILRV